jgi:putative DNA primase/helicase
MKPNVKAKPLPKGIWQEVREALDGIEIDAPGGVISWEDYRLALIAENAGPEKNRFSRGDAVLLGLNEGYYLAPERPPSLTAYPDNDEGRAQRFVDRHIADIRYVPDKAEWLVWGGQSWVADRDQRVVFLAMEHSRELAREVIDREHDPKARAAMLAQIARLGDERKIRAMLNLASAKREVVVRSARLDTNPLLLGLPGGVWDFAEGKMREGRRGDFITLRAKVDPVPSECPLWKSHIDFVTGGDAVHAEFLQRLAGYCLTGNTEQRCWFFFYGPGSNGKSVFIQTLADLAGDLGHKAEKTLFVIDRHGKKAQDEIAAIEGKRLIYASEIDQMDRLDEAGLKDLADGKPTLIGRWQHGRRFRVNFCGKLMVYGNHKPSVLGTDNGVWERLLLLPWMRCIPADKKDLRLIEKLVAYEGAGIMHWALEGARRYLEDGHLAVPGFVHAAVAEYRNQEDVLVDYIDDRLVFAPDAFVGRTALYQDYSEWCKSAGIRALGNKGFFAKIRDRGGIADGKREGRRAFVGVGIRA